MRFDKGDLIWHDNDNYKVICCDEEFATLAKVYWVKDESGDSFKRTDFENIIIVHNLVQDDGFEYKKLYNE